MIKRMTLLIGLATALFLLTSAPAMAVNCKDDCIMTVTMQNDTTKVQFASVLDDKCMLYESAHEANIQPGDSFTFVLKYNMDAGHCQEIGMFEHNNGYFTVAAQQRDTGRRSGEKWEIHIESSGDGENIWFGSLEQKWDRNDMQCNIVSGHELRCYIRGGKIKGGAEF